MTHVGLSLSFADALISCSTDFHLNLENFCPCTCFDVLFKLSIANEGHLVRRGKARLGYVLLLRY